MTRVRARATKRTFLCEYVSEGGPGGYPAGVFARGDEATDTAAGPARLGSSRSNFSATRRAGVANRIPSARNAVLDHRTRNF